MKLTKLDMSRNIIQRDRMVEADDIIENPRRSDPEVLHLSRTRSYDDLVVMNADAVDTILALLVKVKKRNEEARIRARREELGLPPGTEEPTLEELAEALKEARALLERNERKLFDLGIEDDRERFNETSGGGL